jgi:ubiquinone/menaquinone biosynthesis C-methylase UbiE
LFDVGCGYGREIPLLAKRGCIIFAIDILRSMVNEVKKKYGSMVKEIRVDNIEQTMYNDGMFDKVFCWAAMDCINQDKALCEMVRVTQVGGCILFTGKNIEYPNDDRMALVAEKKSLEKGFPNTFTDVYKLIQLLPFLGLKLKLGRGFKYRGDFTLNKFINLNSYLGVFYEYVLILEKIKNKVFNEDLSIFDTYSKNYKKREE